MKQSITSHFLLSCQNLTTRHQFHFVFVFSLSLRVSHVSGIFRGELQIKSTPPLFFSAPHPIGGGFTPTPASGGEAASRRASPPWLIRKAMTSSKASGAIEYHPPNHSVFKNHTPAGSLDTLIASPVGPHNLSSPGFPNTQFHYLSRSDPLH